MKLEDMSTYFLILELFNEGSAGFYPESEPFEQKAIIAELEMRYGTRETDGRDSWAKWFLAAEEHATELERANFLMFLETRQHMRDVWKKLRS